MSLMQRGFTRLLHEGQQIDLLSPDDYPRDDFDDVYVLVDRLVARPDVRQRVVDSLETCFREGHGQAVIQVVLPSAVGRGAGGEGNRALKPSPNPLPQREGKTSNLHDDRTHLRFSERFECKYDGTIYATPEPRLFSFNNPFGACPTCDSPNALNASTTARFTRPPNRACLVLIIRSAPVRPARALATRSVSI